jgi:hypothetical protein
MWRGGLGALSSPWLIFFAYSAVCSQRSLRFETFHLLQQKSQNAEAAENGPQSAQRRSLQIVRPWASLLDEFVFGSAEKPPQRTHDPARQYDNDGKHCAHHGYRRIRMLSGEPGQKDGESIFSET